MRNEDADALKTAADFRRAALRIFLWFIALSLGFNALFGDMGWIQSHRQRRALAALGVEVRALQQKNATLLADIQALRRDPWRIETIAREELGLGRPGEILFLFEPDGAAPAEGAPDALAGPGKGAAAMPAVPR